VIKTFLEWVENTPLALWVGEAAFPYIESAHVVFLAIVAGSIFTVDARLLGLASRHLRITYLAERLLPWTWAAFAGAVVTGALMFIGNASRYADNTPFLIKMGLLLLAGLNMVYFQSITYRRVQEWDTGRPALGARAAGLVSIVSWTGVVAFGRWIGFV
jgi:hypothetical protein